MSKEKNYLFYRVYLVFIGFILLMGLVVYKTAKIQFDGKENVFSDSEAQIPYRTVEKLARKGDILDRNLNTLLTHVPYYDIYMDPSVVDQETLDKNINALAQGLAKIFKSRTAQYYMDQILRARKNGNKNVLIQRRVTNSQKKMVQALPIFKLGRFKGGLIDDVETIQIQKPLSPMLNRTLGDNRGIGVYGAFQAELEGENGEEIERRFANGWKKIGQVLKNPVRGADIVSTIDKDIQEVAHAELSNQILKLEADHGSVIVMEVETGFIRAIANLKRKKNGTCADEYNYAIGYGEVPGSTMKLASIMAGLEDGKFSIYDTVNAKGSYYFPGGNKLDDSNNGYGYGRITIQSAFEHSSNVIAEIINDSYKEEPEKFLNQLQRFSLLDPLGVRLKGERNPVFPRPGDKSWNAITLPWMSIGYSVIQTPLQTLAFYNAVANKGRFMRPQFVEGIKYSSGQYVEKKPEVIKEKICSEKTLESVQACLKGVMTRGTGKRLKSTMFETAGKTGTAKILNSKGNFGDKETRAKYQASFVGYFPADNPIYSCIVVISDPNPEIAYYGSVAAGTVFSEVADKVYATAYKYHDAINESNKKEGLPDCKNGNGHDLKVVSEELGIENQGSYNGQWCRTDVSDGKTLKLIPLVLRENLVPNVVGMNAKDAVYLLEKRGLKVDFHGRGKVLKQSMNEGEPVVKGKIIRIDLG